MMRALLTQTTLPAPALAALSTGIVPRRDAGAPAALAIYPTEQGADARCDGCDQIASDVGFLLPYLVTHRDHSEARVMYCATCRDIVQASIKDPGGSHGAAALPDTFIAIELLPIRFPAAVAPTELYQRYRLACLKTMRRWTSEAIHDLLTFPMEEHDARIMAEEYAIRELGRPLHGHETRLLAEAVRDVVAAQRSMERMR